MNIKKILLILLLLTPFLIKSDEICDNDSVKVISVQKGEITGHVIEKAPVSFDGTNVNVDLSMEDVGDSITYKLVMKNTSEMSYELDDPKTNLNSEFLDYSYTYENGKVIKPNEEKNVYLNIKYSNSVPRVLFTNGKYNEDKSILMSLSSDVIINPKTGVRDATIILIIVSLISLGIYMLLSKNKYGYFFVFLATLLIIPRVNAICKCDVNLIMNVEVTKAPEKLCTFDGELVQGAEFIDGSFTYRYKQDNHWVVEDDWKDIDEDGWGAVYGHFGEEEDYPAIVEQPCTSINGKPLVSTYGMFAYANMDYIDLSTLDTSHVTDMSYMFFCSNSTKDVDMRMVNTSNTKTMWNTFGHSNISNLDITSFDTSKVTNFGYTFSNMKYDSIDFSKLNLSSASNINGMFDSIDFNTLDLSSIDFSNVRNVNYLFDHAKINNLILGVMNTSNATSMKKMFIGAEINNLQLDRIDASNVTNMDSMFSYVKLSDFNMNKLSNINKVENMHDMFYKSNINNLIIDGVDLSNVTDSELLFSNATINNLTLSNLVLPQITTSWFANLIFDNLVLNNIDSSNVTNMTAMFSNIKTHNLDLSSFNTSNVTNMKNLFSNSEIDELILTNWDTSNVTNMQYMFYNSKIPVLDLSSFSVRNDASLGSMFQNCTATVGYAKNAGAAERFNYVGITKIPNTLVFNVKEN